MTRERLYLFDTTLRDGQQTPGVTFSLDDKLVIMDMLDKLGVDYIEGGYPGGNPTDNALFGAERNTRATFTAFGMTKRAGRSASNDSGLQPLLQAHSKAICFVAKTWDYHVRVALGCSNEENLETICDSVSVAKSAGKEVLVDCEHFFDGYKANPDYATACAKAAYESGARWVVLCDTNGGTLPSEISEIVRTMTKIIPGTHLGIHAHNDTEQAVANSLAAVDAGCRQIQGTLNGLGERCGNANLVSIIGTLGLKPQYTERFETGANLSELTAISRSFDELLNRSPYAQAPYVGKSAFATKAGIHASALAKEPETYCGSGPGKNPAYMAAAQALGKAMAAADIGLVYGGGGMGLMGEVARGVLAAGGHVTGIIPEFLVSRERMLDGVNELIVTTNMHERKTAMFERATGFVALPGGIGTLEELAEILTWAQLGQHAKPIVICDIDGYWQPLLTLLEHMRSESFIRAGMEVLVDVAKTAADVVPQYQFRRAKQHDIVPLKVILDKL